MSFYFSENKLAHSCTYCTFANDIQHTYKKCTMYKFICVYVLPYLQYSQFKCIFISRYIKVTEILNKDVFFFPETPDAFCTLIKFAVFNQNFFISSCCKYIYLTSTVFSGLQCSALHFIVFFTPTPIS